MLSIKNPPIMQLVLTVSFTPPLEGLSIIDLADLYAQFRDEFPIFAQVQRAGAMSYKPFEATMTVGDMPRVIFGAEGASVQVGFQSDRLTMLWSRTTPIAAPANYPGFDDIVARYFAAMFKLQAWMAARRLPEITPAVGEVAYVDALPLDVAGADQRRPISSVIKTVNPDVLFPMISLEHAWNEPLTGDLEGFVRVQITAPNVMADGTVAVGFDTTVSFAPGGSWSEARINFEKAHQASLAVFERVVNLDALAISE
jgi:uncharacterized protein (TIGR04255 family)